MKFEMKYRPGFEWNGGSRWNRDVNGDAVIFYKKTDGRGRPCRNLSISANFHQTYVLDEHQESSN